MLDTLPVVASILFLLWTLLFIAGIVLTFCIKSKESTGLGILVICVLCFGSSAAWTSANNYLSAIPLYNLEDKTVARFIEAYDIRDNSQKMHHYVTLRIVNTKDGKNTTQEKLVEAGNSTAYYTKEDLVVVVKRRPVAGDPPGPYAADLVPFDKKMFEPKILIPD
ncbi:MAG: hypothetical protein WC797_01530 [Candidatus Paceibacterota bacterium]|jgi:ABC-type transport system involved in multi-copper enzyme maturation permease subunit